MKKSTKVFESNRASKATEGKPTVKVNYEISEDLAVKLDSLALKAGKRMNFMARDILTNFLNNN